MHYLNDGGVFVLVHGDMTCRTESRLSPNEADRLFDALVLYRADRDAAAAAKLPVDEPELITGDA
jgi:hypothetical protein